MVASRSEQPAAASRARTLAALGVGTVLTATTSTSIAAATTLGGTTLKLVAKMGLALVVAGGASGLAWHATRNPANVAARTTSAPRSAPRAAAATPLVAPEPPLPAEVRAVDAPPAEGVAIAQAATAPSRGAHPRAAASSDTLAQQVAALEKAHAALAAQDPDAALRALDLYRARFPDGTLSSEEKVLRVKATLARGDKSGAASLAAELRATDPNSPYARRVGALVSSDKAEKH